MGRNDIWKMSLVHTAKSDVGLRRLNNQDSFLVRLAPNARQWLERGHVFVVADGMGAHLAGEVASRLATETITKSYLGRITEAIDQSLVQAVYDAHAAIRLKSQEDAFRDMGTTCDALALTPQGLFIGHVGDSRVYRLRGTTLDQMTFDHSLVWEVCKHMNIPYDEPPSHIPKNQITRSLGPTEKLLVDLEGPLPIEVGDTYLACSDGLTGHVADIEVGQILAVFPPDTAAETLVNLANLRGGTDNITMVIVKTTENNETSQTVDNEMLVPGWIWGILGGGVLAGIGGTAGILWGAMILGALLLLIATAASIAFFVLAQKTLFAGSPFHPLSVPKGEAPYRTWNAAPNAEFASALAKILNEMFQVTQGQQYATSIKTAQRYESEAVTGIQNGNFVSAVRNYALAINALMREIKKTEG